AFSGTLRRTNFSSITWISALSRCSEFEWSVISLSERSMELSVPLKSKRLAISRCAWSRALRTSCMSTWDTTSKLGMLAMLDAFGSVSEWPKEAVCKIAGAAYDGSNPSRPTINKRPGQETHLRPGPSSLFCGGWPVGGSSVTEPHMWRIRDQRTVPVPGRAFFARPIGGQGCTPPAADRIGALLGGLGRLCALRALGRLARLGLAVRLLGLAVLALLGAAVRAVGGAGAPVGGRTAVGVARAGAVSGAAAIRIARAVRGSAARRVVRLAARSAARRVACLAARSAARRVACLAARSAARRVACLAARPAAGWGARVAARAGIRGAGGAAGRRGRPAAVRAARPVVAAGRRRLSGAVGRAVTPVRRWGRRRQCGGGEHQGTGGCHRQNLETAARCRSDHVSSLGFEVGPERARHLCPLSLASPTPITPEITSVSQKYLRNRRQRPPPATRASVQRKASAWPPLT